MPCEFKLIRLFSVYICDLPGICLQFMLSEVKHSENMLEHVSDIDQKTYSEVSRGGGERKVVLPFRDT